jgi:Calcineurin-like phosphoesterase
VIEKNPPDPAHPVWTAGRSIVVFMGDLIDKGPRVMDVLDFVPALRHAAQAGGGQVFSVMGNHEAEFLADPSSEKSEEFSAALKSRAIAPSDVAACRGAVGEFLCTEPFALRIRDWFFSHGGDTHGQTLATLSADLQSGVDAAGFATPALLADDSLLEARLGEKGENGRPWVESAPGHDARALLQAYTQALGVKHIVQAHQHAAIAFADGVRRKKGQMFQRDGLLFLVDTGMSEGVDDSDGAVMLIQSHPEQAVAICANGSRTRIWDAQTNPAVGAAKVCGR